jgi:hypothetical protein
LARKDDLVNPVGETKKDEESNNHDEVTISAIKKAWNNNQKNIARAPTWSMNLKAKSTFVRYLYKWLTSIPYNLMSGVKSSSDNIEMS